MRTERLVYNIFTKKCGISLKAETSRFLVECVENASQDSELAAEWLESIAHEWTQSENSCLLVELDALKEVLKKMSQQNVSSLDAEESSENPKKSANTYSISMSNSSGRLDERKFFSVVSAYDVPQLWYDNSKGNFVKPDSTLKFANASNQIQSSGNKFGASTENSKKREIKYSGLVTSPEVKSELFRQRYDAIRQRLQRNETYLRETSLGNTWNGHIFIDTIGSLKGREGRIFVIFGMLTQLEEGTYFIEDKDQSIRLDLSRILLKNENDSGIITQNSFVLIEGELSDDIFVVGSIMQPPPETRAKSISHFKGTNFFGGPEYSQDTVTLEAIESLDDNGAIVFLSEVWLDKPEMLDQLKKLFNGFATSRIPLAFVFIGDFSSQPYVPGSNAILQHQENMNKLADIILEYPEIAKQCYFVFVSGPGDPWGMNALPYQPLPNFITEKFQARVHRSIFTTNPCRIKFCSQEIVVFRQDLVKKMRRSSIFWPKGKDDIFEEHVVKTLINQSHLSPLPTSVSPVFWGYDHSLRIYPAPHLLVLADRFEPYSVFHNGVLAINPGSFSSNGFKFSVYLPSTKTAQLSQIPSS